MEELLSLVVGVFRSGNAEAAETLERNIRSLAHTVELEGRLASIEERLKVIEKKAE